MMQPPAIAAALGKQRHAAFLAEAETARLARAARAARSAGDGNGSAKWPVRWLAPRRQPRIPATRSSASTKRESALV